MGIWQPITLLVFPLMRLHSVRLQPVFYYDSLDVRPGIRWVKFCIDVSFVYTRLRLVAV